MPQDIKTDSRFSRTAQPRNNNGELEGDKTTYKLRKKVEQKASFMELQNTTILHPIQG
jgi:hypothetical protein